MTTRTHIAFTLICGIAFFGILAGCNQADQSESANKDSTTATGNEDDYDPHDVPITDEQEAALRKQTTEFPRAVKVLNDLRDEVEQETAAGIPDEPYTTHQALDKADMVLQWLPEIARDSSVPKKYWEQINVTANDLRTLFEKVHQNIDNKKDPNFAAVANDMDQKLTSLEEIAAAQAADAETKK